MIRPRFRRKLAAFWLFLVASLSTPAIADNPQVLIKTDFGDITVRLFADKAPRTVANFLAHARRYYYDGVIFHRVVPGFIIQTGGYTFDLFAKSPGDPVVNESANGLKNHRATLAMARFDDPDSARAQFFINLADNTSLDPTADKPGYTVFGEVTEGMAVADAIGKLKTRRSEKFSSLPYETVRILSIREVANDDQTERQPQ